MKQYLRTILFSLVRAVALAAAQADCGSVVIRVYASNEALALTSKAQAAINLRASPGGKNACRQVALASGDGVCRLAQQHGQ